MFLCEHLEILHMFSHEEKEGWRAQLAALVPDKPGRERMRGKEK